MRVPLAVLPMMFVMDTPQRCPRSPTAVKLQHNKSPSGMGLVSEKEIRIAFNDPRPCRADCTVFPVAAFEVHRRRVSVGVMQRSSHVRLS
jgi:hypothetical protein